MVELERKELIPIPETFGLGQRPWETYNFGFWPGMDRERLDYLLELKSKSLERYGYRFNRVDPAIERADGLNFVVEFVSPVSSDGGPKEAKAVFSSAWWAVTETAIVALVSEVRETMREQIAGNFGFEQEAGDIRAYRI